MFIIQFIFCFWWHRNVFNQIPSNDWNFLRTYAIILQVHCAWWCESRAAHDILVPYPEKMECVLLKRIRHSAGMSPLLRRFSSNISRPCFQTLQCFRASGHLKLVLLEVRIHTAEVHSVFRRRIERPRLDTGEVLDSGVSFLYVFVKKKKKSSTPQHYFCRGVDWKQMRQYVSDGGFYLWLWWKVCPVSASPQDSLFNPPATPVNRCCPQ